MGLLESTWVYLGLLGSTWVYLGLLGSTWVYLVLHGSTWPVFVYLGLIRTHKPISGRTDGRSGRRLSPAASLLRAPYGANNAITDGGVAPLTMLLTIVIVYHKILNV